MSNFIRIQRLTLKNTLLVNRRVLKTNITLTDKTLTKNELLTKSKKNQINHIKEQQVY